MLELIVVAIVGNIVATLEVQDAPWDQEPNGTAIPFQFWTLLSLFFSSDAGDDISK